ncbi:MAG: chemotaxis protein CheB, partial [Usitatibacter sp.]
MQGKSPPKDPTGHEEAPILPAVNPAAADHATPETSLPFPIVGIGASAGGIEAFGEMLQALPTDTGMAFVLVQHLSPDHESILAEIFSRRTTMPVEQARDGGAVEPNHVYVIPPASSMVLANGALHLSLRTAARGAARQVDQFMRSLAQEHGHKAIGVVLSGTGSDGTLGIEEIKAAGGITFVQDNTAEHDGMPRSALAGGAVDYVLPPSEIALELARIASHPYIAPADQPAALLSDADMQRVLEALRGEQGVDFSQYKRNTMYRRITRRMLLHRVDTAAEYLQLLAEDPVEVEALYRDVLINVTSFFRNPEAYEALKATVFAKLTEDRSRQDPVRIWALGCSTGEEAYSLAMAFTEYLEESGRRASLQIFATDVNGAGIERARTGIYPKGITQDVSPERLRRFFAVVDGSYRICKPIRDMCIFARQNVLADPPFSRIDLVACRNLMIYLEPALQQRLIPLVHYALRGHGHLWLGGSETIGSYRELFDLLDARNKIYVKKQGPRTSVTVPSNGTRWIAHAGVAPPQVVEPAHADSQREADRLLLIRYAPPGVVINQDLEILQFRGDTSPFLRPPPGKASHNLIKMLREGLMVAVRGAVSRARRDQLPTREEGLKVRSNGGWRAVDIVVLPLKGASAGGGSLLVLFEEPSQSVEARVRLLDAEAMVQRSPGPDEGDVAKELIRLKQELSATRDYLQSVIEQQEAANEELQSANEEVQSSNEEL